MPWVLCAGALVFLAALRWERSRGVVAPRAPLT
jgi:hypothetical protein